MTHPVINDIQTIVFSVIYPTQRGRLHFQTCLSYYISISYENHTAHQSVVPDPDLSVVLQPPFLPQTTQPNILIYNS